MKFCKNLILFLSFSLICSCGTNEQINETTKNSTNQTINENEENSDKEVASSEEKSTPSQEAVNEIIQEFPNGLVSFLSKTERICLFETASSLVIRQMEVDLMFAIDF